MKMIYNNSDFWLAFSALLLIVVGELCRQGFFNKKNIFNFLKISGWAGLVGGIYLIIVYYGNLTTRSEAGAFNIFSPFFKSTFELNKIFASWTGKNSQPLITGGITLLFFSGVLALTFKRKAGFQFFWAAFCLALAIKGQSSLLAGQKREAFWFYLIAIAGAFMFSAFKDQLGRRERRNNKFLKKSGIILILIWALLIGFYKLDQLPPFDQYEATNGLVALQVNKGDADTFKFIWSYWPRSYGADSCSCPFLIMFLALLFKIEGVSLFIFRSGAIFWSLMSLLLLYLLIKQLFGYRSALLSTFLLTISPWYLAITRVAMFGSISIFFALLIFYLLFRAIRSFQIIYYILLGFALSFYAYFYLPTKLLFPVVIVMFLFKAIFYKGFLKKNWAGITSFLAIFILFLSFQTPPLEIIRDTAYPNAGAWPFIGSESGADINIRWGIIPGQVLENLNIIVKNLTSAPTGRSFIYYAPGPLINPVIFVLAILGLVFSLWHWKQEEYFLLLAWLGPAFFPTLALVSCVGCFPRHGLLAIPLIYIFASVFIVKTSQVFTGLAKGKMMIVFSSISIFAIIILLFSLASSNLTRYFNRTPQDYAALGRNVKQLLSQGYNLIIHIDDRNLGPARIIDFIAYPEVKKLYYYHNRKCYYDYHKVGDNPRYRYKISVTGLEESLKELLDTQAKAVLIVSPRHRKGLSEKVQNLIPGVEIEEIRSKNNRIVSYQCLIDPEKIQDADSQP